MPSTPVRIVSGSNDEYPSDPVRIANWDAFLQALWDELGLNPDDGSALSMLMYNMTAAPPTLNQTSQVAGGVEKVSVGWTAHKVNIGGTWIDLPGGSVVLNTGHVAVPTTYYIYAKKLTATTAQVVASIVDPEVDPLVNYHYAWVSIARLKEAGGVATIYYVRNAWISMEYMLHYEGEWDFLTTPTYVSGGAITIDGATGEIDIDELVFRRLRLDGEIGPYVDGHMLFGDETASVGDLESITSYRDGSPITAGKYIKLLLGAMTSRVTVDYPFMVIRQNKPAVEYASRAAALQDDYNVAGATFPDAYRGAVIPIAYIIMKLGDASDLETVDLRGGNLAGGGGGGTPVADHSLLANLGADNHAQYLRTDGTRQLTGDMLVTAGKAVDGVDISAHQHTGVGLNGPALQHANLTGLGNDDHTIYLKADGSRALAGNLAVNGGVQVDGVDIGSHNHDAGIGNGVKIAALNLLGFDEAAQDAVGNILAATGDITLTYDDATPKITANLNTEGELQVVLAVGNNNNIAISTARLIYITGPAGNFTITGVAGGYAGKRVYLYNTTTNNMTIPNEDVLSLAANRIRTLGPTVATSGVGVVELIYSGLASRWIVVGQHG